MNPIPERNRKYVYESVNTESTPDISIVSIIYKKEREIGIFLQSLCEQSFTGNYEIILVNDNTPDNSIAIVDEYISNYVGKTNITFKIINNYSNLGNCECRNIGIRNSVGKIIVIMDADCVVNTDFLISHYNAYLYNDCDAANGYMNIDIKKENIFSVKSKLEKSLPNLPTDYIAQDPTNTSSFLNCVTRNFSIRKDFIEGDLFNIEYSYSNKPDSGFGWEDIEMGYRLYKRGARIKFLPNTFSIHCYHVPVVPEGSKPLKSLKNFRKLIENNPELICIARKWIMMTYSKILDWITHTYKNVNGANNLNNIVSTNPDLYYLNKVLHKFRSNPFFIKKSKKLNILTYRWHCGHQYELYKSGHNFTLLTGTGTSICEGWDFGVRPMPVNAKFLASSRVNPSHYDLAILHFDENVLSPQTLYTSGVLSPATRWGDTFKWFKDNVKIPQVAICHGTPQFYGQYTSSYIKNEDIKVIEEERKKLVDYLSDTLVIVNSHQARAEWGFKRSKVIWHGFDPTEFPQSTYDRGILTLGKDMQQRPHYRGLFLFNDIMNNFPVENLPHVTNTPIPIQYQRGSSEYAQAKYRNYINTIREYSIYLNPTYRSPMPRSRGEAMMCGLVTVNANNHDVEMFINNTINGFYSNDPDELREYLLFLIRKPSVAKNIGTLSRNTAIDIFNHDRYLKEWENIYKELVK